MSVRRFVTCFGATFAILSCPYLIPRAAAVPSDSVLIVRRSDGSTLGIGKKDPKGAVTVTLNNGTKQTYTPTDIPEPDGFGLSSDTAIVLDPLNTIKAGKTDIYFVEPTSACGCTENEPTPSNISDLFSMTVTREPGTDDKKDFDFSFNSDPIGLPTTLPKGAITITENGTLQSIESLLFPGTAPGTEPFVVMVKSCSCSEEALPEPGSISLLGSGLFSAIGLACRRRASATLRRTRRHQIGAASR